MRITTFLGIVLALVLVLVVFTFWPDDLRDLFNPMGILITIGGTITAGIVSFSWQSLGPVFEALSLTLVRGSQPMSRLYKTLMSTARQVKKAGLEGLELPRAGGMDPYLRLGLQLVADATPREKLEEVMTLESEALTRRREIAERVFRVMGSYSPMFGLMGTILGLIRMLRNLTDASQIGSGMAVALVTTFYGVLAAGLVFLPLAWKVRELAAYEDQRRGMILCGVLAIQAGENPQLLQEKLDTFTRTGEGA